MCGGLSAWDISLEVILKCGCVATALTGHGSLGLLRPETAEITRSVSLSPRVRNRRNGHFFAAGNSSKYKYQAGNKYIHHGQRQQDLPSQVHQLIIAEAGKGPSNEQQEPAEAENFQGERGDLQKGHKQ